jgi:thymidylate kinase
MVDGLIAPFNALLIEGIPGIGKSTLIDVLVRRHVNSADVRQIRSLVHLCQAHTIGPLASAEDAGTLTVKDNLNHLEHIVSIISWLYESVREHKRQSCFALVDTLHLTHCLRPGVLAWQDVAEFDRRLAAMGCKLIVLQAEAAVVRERAIEARTTWSFLRNYMSKFGRTDEELHKYFMYEQEQFVQMFEKSMMPKLLMPNDGDVESIADEAYKFWREAIAVKAGQLA